MKVFKLLFISTLFLWVQNSYAIDKCKMVKAMDQRLEQDKESLNMLKKIHHEILQAKELKRRILNGEDILEVALLAEAIEEEVQGIKSYDEKVKKGLVISTGSAMLAGFVWFKVNRDTRGLGLGKRLFHSVIPKPGSTPGRMLSKVGVNMVLLVSISSTFWLGKQLKENYEKKNLLRDLIKKINKIKDLSGEILVLSNKIDNDQILLDMKIEELEDEGIIEYIDGEIHCL